MISRIDADGNQVNLRSFQAVFAFEQDELDEDGYTWYDSVLDDGTSIVSIEMGIQEIPTDTSRQINLKFRGEYAKDNGTTGGFWSLGTFEAPESFTVATIGLDECFILDSVDLAQLCGGSQCVGDRYNEIEGLVLQRLELCGNVPAIPGDGATLTEENCPN
jgi:hypothetical protein